MRTTVLLLASLSLAACASAGNVPDERLTDTFSGTVNGVIVLPQQAGGIPCSGLTVYATAVGDQAKSPSRLGRPSIHDGSSRCSYQIDNLPPQPVEVHIEPAAGMACRDGSSLSFGSTGSAPFTVNAHESVTRDFRAQCGASS